MTQRDIVSNAPPAGESFVLNDRGTNFTLFIPKAWVVPKSGDVALTIHFHSAVWFAIQEHLRRGLDAPLVAFYLGEGSSKYRAPFEDPERFGRILRLVEQKLNATGSVTNLHVTTVDISSFSAGYGAVREIVKASENLKLIRRIVLCDSLYGSFAKGTDGGELPQPAPEHIDPWLPFIRSAASGEKTFALTFSEVPTPTYASSSQCAEALVKALDGQFSTVAAGSCPATLDAQFPLKSRFDKGNFHAWGYGGTNSQAHLTHVRHLADVWQMLNAAQNP